MTSEEILQTFSDINYAYNNSTKYDTLKRMLDELTEPCEDCISRAELLKAVDTWDKFGCDADIKLVPFKDCYVPYIYYDDVVKAIKGMPSIQPKPKTGHWIYICNSEVNGLKICKCSNCKKKTYGSHKFCPNCGAKMKNEV